VVETYVGLYLGMSGRYSEALERLDAALARFARDKQLLWVAVASNHKAQLLCQLGQFARARQALDYAEPPVESVRARGALVAARIERGLGHSGHAAIQRAVETLAPGSDPNVRMLVLLDAAPADDPQLALERVDEVLAMAERMEFGGVAMAARLRRAQLQCRAGEVQAAAAAMRDLVERLDAVQPSDLTLGEAWWAAAQVFDAAGDGDETLMALARGAQWVRRVALPQVPEAFRDSFLQRNPSHRALLAAADRRIAQ
jgi:tetratricopeptide (TPR) repeat protein